MEMFTVGAALKFAIQLEERVKASHERAAGQTNQPAHKEAFTKLASANLKRMDVLKRIYNDHVYSDMDTGVLAPISSMDGANYLTPGQASEAAGNTHLIQVGLIREESLNQFYLDLKKRLQSGPRTITRKIEKIVAENTKRINDLKSHLK